MSDVNSASLRKALGYFGTGVCVVTAMQETEHVAMTINSFSSVSLEPALILWSIRNESRLLDTFVSGDTFNISILAEDQVDLSNRCARGGRNPLLDHEYEMGCNGQPVLVGALTTFECLKWSAIPAGDHITIFGEVTHLHHNDKGKPLMFYSGSYSYLQKMAS